MVKAKESWASSDAARARMQANRAKDTKAELALRRELHRRGFRYFVHRQPVPGLRRTADLVFSQAKVAVFVDGCFWHGCPEHHTVSRSNASFWAEKVRRNRERDRDTDARLRDDAWTVVRIWEHEPTRAAADHVASVVRKQMGLLAEDTVVNLDVDLVISEKSGDDGPGISPSP